MRQLQGGICSMFGWSSEVQPDYQSLSLLAGKEGGWQQCTLGCQRSAFLPDQMKFYQYKCNTCNSQIQCNSYEKLIKSLSFSFTSGVSHTDESFRFFSFHRYSSKMCVTQTCFSPSEFGRLYRFLHIYIAALIILFLSCKFRSDFLLDLFSRYSIQFSSTIVTQEN